ncbi:MAG: hypothetical protein LBE84_11120 [Planctomycetota bacterium]|jgi:hypothetical protein|nr:hypothetical protein [Planctomycetota bacterium]
MFWEKIAARFGVGKNRPDEGNLRQRLLHIIHREGGMELNAPTLAEFGADFRQVCREAYSLAGQECLHLLAEPGEPVALLSNEQFNQITRIRACLPELRRAQAPARQEEKKETVPASVFFPAFSEKKKSGKGQPDDLNWFSLEVAMPDRKRRARAGGRGKRREAPADRRILPERRREPWVVLDAASLEAEFSKKK